jgi:hypothetical protein
LGLSCLMLMTTGVRDRPSGLGRVEADRLAPSASFSSDYIAIICRQPTVGCLSYQQAKTKNRKKSNGSDSFSVAICNLLIFNNFSPSCGFG